MMGIITGAFISFLLATSANAYCSQPGRAPEAPKSYDKPRPPACLQSARYGGEHDCEDRDLDRYRTDVDRYIRSLERYAADIQRHAEEAAEYARCEANEARESLPR